MLNKTELFKCNLINGKEIIWVHLAYFQEAEAYHKIRSASGPTILAILKGYLGDVKPINKNYPT